MINRRLNIPSFWQKAVGAWNMRTLACLSSLLLVFTFVGCGQDRNPGPPPMSGFPVSRIPVGPIPGPAQKATLPQNPYAGNTVALQKGHRLFVWFNCAGCHGPHGGGGTGPNLRGMEGTSDAKIFEVIAQGRGTGMPAWGMKLPENQIWMLVSYIKSLGTNEEPDPPLAPSKHKVIQTQ